MATISITRVNTGDTVNASDHNNMATVLETAINGGIENVNIKAGADIALSKLASGGATTGQLMRYSGSAWAPSSIGNAILTASSTPPGTPADGDIWLYTGLGSGINWMFRYNNGSASAYKWEFIGGSPWTGHQNSTSNANGSGTYSDLTGTPSVTLAREGDYIVRWYSRFDNSNAPTYNVWLASSLSATDANAIGFSVSADYGDHKSAVKELKVTGVSASTVAKLQGRSDAGGGVGTFSNFGFSVQPIRVI